MAFTFFSGKNKVKRIVLLAVAAVLIVVLIAGNIILSQYAGLLSAFFAGASGSTESESAKNALSSADGVVREIAEESIVLLKNDVDENGKGFLPREKTEKFNLFGWASTDQGFQLVGGGSGGTSVDVSKDVIFTLREAFEEEEVEYNADLLKAYSDYSSFDADYRQGGSTGANAVESLRNPPESFYTTELLENAYNYSTTAVVTLSRWGAENGGAGELITISGSNGGTGNFSNGSYLELTPEEKAMFDALKQKNFDVVVLLNTTNPLELGFLDNYANIKACLYVGIPGQSGATAIPKILVGDVNPSGRLSDTSAKSWQEHNPTYNNTLSQSQNIAYQEGIYFGYKWYETAYDEGYYEANGTTYEEVVAYPFGHGLSYTTFTQEIITDEAVYTEMEAENPFFKATTIDPNTTYSVIVRVTNVGDVAGKDVVQLYNTPPYENGKVEVASVNLLAFGKTVDLAPANDPDGKINFQNVVLTFTGYDMASYDAEDKDGNGHKGYEILQGDYTVSLRKNAHELFEAPDEPTGDSVNEITVNVAQAVKITADPVTGETVKNRFTGDTAYGGSPIDGGLTYLSRADGFANYAA